MYCTRIYSGLILSLALSICSSPARNAHTYSYSIRTYASYSCATRGQRRSSSARSFVQQVLERPRELETQTETREQRVNVLHAAHTSRTSRATVSTTPSGGSDRLAAKAGGSPEFHVSSRSTESECRFSSHRKCISYSSRVRAVHLLRIHLSQLSSQ